MKEIWKDIKGYEGYYQVSNLGRIKNKHNKLLKPYVTTTGYYKIDLRKNKTRKITSIHRLIAQTFIPNIDNLPEVNHKDGNKANNCINNLEWVTRSDNLKHAYKNRFAYSIRI